MRDPDNGRDLTGCRVDQFVLQVEDKVSTQPSDSIDESSIMDEVTRMGASLPKRSRSKRTQSTSGREKPRRERGPKESPKSPTTPHSAASSSRPSLAGSRTNSAPLVPLYEVPKPLPITKEADTHAQRDSIASIKDDPFFRHYQTPHSVSLARELRSAIYSERQGDGEVPKLSPPRNNMSPSDSSVTLPVSRQIRHFNGG